MKMKKKLDLLLALCTVFTLAAGCTQTGEKSANSESDIYVGYTTDAGDPVMMCIQAWSDKYNTTDSNATNHAYLADGHWVICVGYKKIAAGYQFYFNDPACIGHCLMPQRDLETRWFNMDGAGTIDTHFGFVIKGRTEYNDAGVFYLN